MQVCDNKVLIRFDDFCSTMNWDNWNKIKRILDLYKIKCLIGVIPDNKDVKLIVGKEKDEYWDYIKQLQYEGHTIAMHGCNHVYDSYHRGIVTYRKKSEFAGLPLKIQYERIKTGKETLLMHGVATEVFFAPGHSYDMRTLIALKKNGFRYMSDGKHSRIIERSGIVCIPCKYSVSPSYEKKGVHTVVIHINNWNSQEMYDEFNKLCSKMHSSIVSFDDVISVRHGIKIVEIIKEWIFVRYEHYFHSFLHSIYHGIKMKA